ncbi:helix-turn-helix domain-containing protein [Flavobacterium sp. NST-5]|uniref:Helix-turn-helix domain-containing protein n=1 Tax=Flavobacterium ichthyis TaxID=2698827 RepID=A0ABW9ZF67_9FLAO|nr:helix-turn-helix domain-containing protein [Flavobacterium ichthyis]NBL65907.1 helix-turn-helix domain-containing protein [Flavobacterium ichthyis]
MENYFNEKKIKRNEFGRKLMFSFLGIFIFYNLLMLTLKFFGDYKFSIDQPTVFFSLIITSYFCFLTTRKKYDFWPLFKIITVGLYILVTYLALVTAHKSMIPCLFYVPIILMRMMQAPLVKNIILSILTLIFCFFVESISEFFEFSQPMILSEEQKKTLEYLSYIIQVLTAYLSMLILYYYNVLNKIDNIIETKEMIKLHKNERPQTTEMNAMQQLFEKIVSYMEEKQPYTDPNFSIQLLSQKLKSNPTYISRALNQEGGKNFPEFIQEYRIKKVIKEIEARNGRTLEELYKSAGFKQQTTFNRRFKELTGKTPSEYVLHIEQNGLNHFT